MAWATSTLSSLNFELQSTLPFFTNYPGMIDTPLGLGTLRPETELSTPLQHCSPFRIAEQPYLFIDLAYNCKCLRPSF